MTPVGIRPSRTLLYTLLGVMLLFWSGNFIFAKLAMRELPAFMVVSVRTLLSGVMMWPVYAIAGTRLEPGMRKWSMRDVPVLLALGIGGVFGNQMLFVIGLSRTSVAHSSVITAMGPIFVLLGAASIGMEHLTIRKVTGMLIAACGVCVLQLGRSHAGGATLTGDLIMIVSTCMFAGFTVFGKRVVQEFGAVTMNTFAFVSGALLVLPYVAWDFWVNNRSQVSSTAWLSVVYMATFPSIFGYLIYSYSLRYLPASRVSSVSYLQPVLATLFAVFILHEYPGFAFLGGAALVMSGVYVTERR